MGASHSATKAFAKAAITMAKVDLWRARLLRKTLRRDQRQAIAAAAEDCPRLDSPPRRSAARWCASRGARVGEGGLTSNLHLWRT